jgi:hypothetical protein
LDNVLKAERHNDAQTSIQRMHDGKHGVIPGSRLDNALNALCSANASGAAPASAGAPGSDIPVKEIHTLIKVRPAHACSRRAAHAHAAVAAPCGTL